MIDKYFTFAAMCFDAPTDGAGGASGDGGGAAVTAPPDAKSEFRQMVAGLKDLVATKHEKTENEFQNQFTKISDRLDDLEFDFETKRKNSMANANESKGFQHKDTFKSAFWEFVKGNRKGLTLEQVNGGKEVKGYHPSIQGETKSDNLVRFDFESSGALLLPAELSDQIIYNAIESTPITRLVLTTTTSRSQKKRNLRVSTPGLSWVEEEGAVSKGKVKYRQVTLTPKKAAARYGVSMENEQDSGYDLFGEVQRAYQEDFNVAIGSACLSGNGNGKPKGMIGELQGFDSGALTLTPDMLIKMQETLLDEYQANGQWLFTRQTRAFIRSLFLTSSNAALQYLWEPDFTRRTPTVLLGAPVNIAREGDMAGDVEGTFTAGQVPVLFGDFQTAYEFTTHTDMFMLDDPYTESERWIRNMNIMSRVDGQPMKTEAAAELRITNS